MSEKMDKNSTLNREKIMRDLKKIIIAADDVSNGKNIQVSKLMPLFRFRPHRTDFARFALYLLEKEYAVVQLTRYSPVTTIETKLDMLAETINVLKQECKGIQIDAEMLYKSLYDLQPGFKRINIHNSFRKASDHELLLADNSLSPLLKTNNSDDYGWSAYYLATTYISTLDSRYNSYRTILKPESATRMLDIVGYWSFERLNMRLDELYQLADYQLEPAPRSERLNVGLACVAPE